MYSAYGQIGIYATELTGLSQWLIVDVVSHIHCVFRVLNSAL